MKRFLALFMAIALLMVSFAACKKNDGDDTTTTAPESTTAENITGDGNTADPTATDTTGTNDPTATDNTQADPNASTDPNAPTDPNASNTQPSGTSETATTTTRSEDGPPVGSDIAKILTYYNDAANATKSAGSFRATKHTLQHLKLQKPTLLVPLANTLLKDIDNKVLDRDETFVNGKGTKNTDYTPTNFLPVKNKPYMSQLTANYVQSATCVKDGNNYKVTIKLKDETVSATSDPPGFSSCSDSVTEDIRNVKEVKISSSAQAAYSQGELVAVINPQGKLISLRQFAAVILTGDLEKGTISIPTVKNAVFNGDFLAEYKFYW